MRRNYLEVGYYLEYVFPAYDVKVIAINNQFESNALNDGSTGMEVAYLNGYLEGGCCGGKLTKEKAYSRDFIKYRAGLGQFIGGTGQ